MPVMFFERCCEMAKKKGENMDKQADRVPGDESPDHGDNQFGGSSPPWAADVGGGGADNYDAAMDEWLDHAAPTLHQFLVLRGWGGRQRKPGTIRLFAEEGKWKACLNDNEAGRYAFVSGSSLLGLLEAVEKGLAGKGLDWRANKKWK